MKTIRKVDVTPLPVNEGQIIDSFNTSDDKHTNAPSLNAVTTELDNYYTKTETNALYKLQGDFAVVNGTITLNNGSGAEAGVAYPTGFNSSNCVVISAQFARGETYSPVEFVCINDSVMGVKLFGNGIGIVIQNLGDVTSGPTGTVQFKVVLMKI